MKITLVVSIIIIALLFTQTLLAAAEPEKKTVEGQGYYFNTGQSYPTSISIIGYNSRDNILYINTELETSRVVSPIETATFNYIIEIYNDAGALLGNAGDFTIPIVQPAALGANTVQILKRNINMTLPLTAQNSVVITIESVNVL